MSSIELLNVQGEILYYYISFIRRDRIVKMLFVYNNILCICPKRISCLCLWQKPMGKVITTKPILPSEEELGNKIIVLEVQNYVFWKKI